MSLNFYLETEPMPHVCSECGHVGEKSEEVFRRNITHNLGGMANEAGIYEALWHPNLNGQAKAKDILPILKSGLSDLLTRPEHYEKFNSKNGWGMYENFVPFVKAVVEACEANPSALVMTSV